MKKALLLTNFLTLSVAVFLAIQITSRKVEPDPCSYPLDRFDFHFRDETRSPNIIMLGTSMTRHGRWDTLLHRNDILNRGISGDKLRCIFSRLEYLRGSSAKICFIEGGITDLPAANLDSLVSLYGKIVGFWRAQNVIPVLSLVIYISPKAGTNFPYLKDYKAINQLIKELNGRTRAFAAQNNVDYIDLNQRLSNEEQLLLKEEYTLDGIHLTNLAYAIWGAEVEGILSKYELSNP